MFWGPREFHKHDPNEAREERNMVRGLDLQGTDWKLEPHPNTTFMDVCRIK